MADICILTAVGKSSYGLNGNTGNRNFHADKPNQKWVTDISYIPTKQETLYLSIIRDLFDNSIVV